MSYVICRVQKFKKRGVTNVQGHNWREKSICKTNKDIDWSRTKYNIRQDYCTSYSEGIKERIAKLPKLQRHNKDGSITNLKRRKDTIYMADVFVGASPEFFGKNWDASTFTKSRQYQYFLDAVEFFKKQYGEENILGYTIHLDEKTPHMHLQVVPIKDNKLNARDLWTPDTLEKLQDDVWEQVGKKHGLDRGKSKRHTGKARKHIPTREYKALQDERRRLQDELWRVEQLKNDINAKWDEIEALELSDEQFERVISFAKDMKETDEMMFGEVAMKC